MSRPPRRSCLTPLAAILPGLLLLVLAAASPAQAYDDVCIGPDKPHGASLGIYIPPDKLDDFMMDLRSFFMRKRYTHASSLTVKSGEVGEILQSMDNPHQNLDVTNVGHPDIVVVSVWYCGADDWRPAWDLFMQFLHDYQLDRRTDVPNKTAD